MGLEARYQLLDRDLSYAVSGKYDMGSSLIGTFFSSFSSYEQAESSRTSGYWRRTI